MLAFIADVASCGEVLWFLLDSATWAIRHPQLLVSFAWNFAALTILLSKTITLVIAWGGACARLGLCLHPVFWPSLFIGTHLKMDSAVGFLNPIFWGPATLFEVWWLTPPIGVFTAWICYAMYPWAFEQSGGVSFNQAAQREPADAR